MSKPAETCPVCHRPRGQRFIVGQERCNSPFHTRDKVRKGRKASWRTMDDSRNTTRGEPVLEDQDPEDHVFYPDPRSSPKGGCE